MRFFKNCKSDASPACRILSFGGHVLLGLVVVAVVAVLIGWVVMTAWNAVMPGLFNLPLLNFWQAVALLVLVRLLTGRLHHHRPRHGRHGRGGKKKCKWMRCFHGEDAEDNDGLPPNPPQFAKWWWEEGETAFRAFQVRQAGSAQQDGAL